MDIKKLTNDINNTVAESLKQEPESIKKIYRGEIPSDAGIGTQFFSTLVFSLIYTLTLGQHMLYHLIDSLHNSKISLDDFKDQVYYFLGHGFNSSNFLGYVLDPKIGEYNALIVENLSKINDRQEMYDLLGAYCTYLNLMHTWLHVRFPWGLGVAFPKAMEPKI